jgi:hypothetical protein
MITKINIGILYIVRLEPDDSPTGLTGKYFLFA